MQEFIVKRIKEALHERGFEFIQFERYCFDIAAKRGGEFLLVKVLMNADSFSLLQADDLKQMASVLEASPVICSFQGRNFKVAENHVYERYGVPLVHPETFISSLDKVMPYIISKKGKESVNIDSSKMHELRAREGISFNGLSDMIGISKKTIYLAEKSGRTSNSVAEAIERFFDDEIRKPVDIFSFDISYKKQRPDDFETIIRKLTEKIGYSNFFFKTTPVNIVFKEDEKQPRKRNDTSLMCDVGRTSMNRKKIDCLKELSEFCGMPSMIITKRSRKRTLDGVAVLTIDDLKRAYTRRILLDMIEDR